MKIGFQQDAISIASALSEPIRLAKMAAKAGGGAEFDVAVEQLEAVRTGLLQRGGEAVTTAVGADFRIAPGPFEYE